MTLFYNADLSTSEYDKIYNHWRKVARNEFTRQQIVMTAEDNMDYSSPLWHAMQDELRYRDELDLKQRMRRELKEAKKRDHLYKTPKSRLKNQQLRKAKMTV